MLRFLLFLIFSMSVLIKLIKCQGCHHIEPSQLICRVNQLTGFYMMATLAFNELMLKTVLTPITLGVY